MKEAKEKAGPMYILPKAGNNAYKQRKMRGKWVHILSPGDYDHVVYGTIKEKTNDEREGI